MGLVESGGSSAVLSAAAKGRCAASMLWVLSCVVATGVAWSANARQITDGRATDELTQWILQEGGTVHAQVGYNAQGVRGLFASRDMQPGELLATIPSACVINVASEHAPNMATGVLFTLRELLNPHSRFKPYIQSWPAQEEAPVTTCNIPEKYWHMFESHSWEAHIAAVQGALVNILAGTSHMWLEYTLQEVVGRAPVTLEDLQYACTMVQSRQLHVQGRGRLMLVPVFDMLNHARNCTTYWSGLDDQDGMVLQVQQPVKAGEELCYRYDPHMRDDHAVAMYGFLPQLEDPPRLLQVDHPSYEPTVEKELPEDPFTGTPEQVQTEVSRLQHILDGLLAADATRAPGPPPGTDPTYDMLTELQQRRRHALRYEVNRLQAELSKGAVDAEPSTAALDTKLRPAQQLQAPKDKGGPALGQVSRLASEL